MNKLDIVKELKDKRLLDTKKNKITENDINRIADNVSGSIFEDDTCTLWGKQEDHKNYLNVKFDKKMGRQKYPKLDYKPLHRLLYNNYVEEIKTKTYVKFLCKNTMQCVNIHHFKLVKINKRTTDGAKLRQIVNTDEAKLILQFFNE